MIYVYLHGFASSPASTKARHFGAQFAKRGIPLIVPVIAPEFENLTVTSQLELASRAIGDAETVTLIGSSMGGYLATLLAERDARVQRMALMAPAFGFAERWAEALAGERADEWRRTRKLDVFHYGEGRMRQLDYEFVIDGARYPSFPQISQPTLILHGRHDEVVPPEASIEFRRRNPAVQVELLDTGHEMTDVIDEVWRKAAGFLGLD